MQPPRLRHDRIRLLRFFTISRHDSASHTLFTVPHVETSTAATTATTAAQPHPGYHGSQAVSHITTSLGETA